MCIAGFLSLDYNNNLRKVYLERAGTENRTRVKASTGLQDNLYPTPATLILQVNKIKQYEKR